VLLLNNTGAARRQKDQERSEPDPRQGIVKSAVMADQVFGGARMIRGSVVVQRRRCGKASCRCADGEQLHESTVLSYSKAGRNRTVMLASREVASVRAAVARYRSAQAKLEQAGNAGLSALLSAHTSSGRGW